jgi:hypothetical protein
LSASFSGSLKNTRSLPLAIYNSLVALAERGGLVNVSALISTKYYIIMNNILDNLFYKEKLGIGNKTTFIKKIRERHPDIKLKEIQEYLKNQEVSQINATMNKTYQYKITAPTRTFQIDIFWWKKSETLIPILLFVDILSRKAWA